MLRLLAAGLRERGLAVPAAVQQALREPQARVALALKRELIEAALRQGGWALLPQLGAGVAALAPEPIGQALGGARDAAELFARWQRLERYVHSRHRVELLALGDGEALLQHRARQRDAAPPSPAESLVVLGVIAALLAWRGLQLLGAETADGLVLLPAADEAALAARVAAGLGPLRLRWRGRMQEAAAAPAPDGWPLALQALLARLDLLQPPALAMAAVQAGLSTRSLQRLLAREGWSWRRLLAEARCRAAAARLLQGGEGLAEIGFACGFADQAHFTRCLRERSGLTPARYREAFGLQEKGPHGAGLVGQARV